MVAYADYSFYQTQYHGTMDEDDFNRHVLDATQYIRYATAGKSDYYSGDELKYAACETTDLYYSMSHDEKQLSGRIKSENNDGYSVSYVTERKDGETTEMLSSRKAYGIIRRWLLATGLLNRKVGCACDYQCRHHDL